MNINNRLRKLETVTDNSTVCACYPQHFSVFIQDLGADAETNEPILSGKPSPDVCPDCLKPTEKNSIIVQLVRTLASASQTNGKQTENNKET